jgi:peptidoglycan/xylan/chitin deacetylase (PgdA/CDA1 family)
MSAGRFAALLVLMATLAWWAGGCKRVSIEPLAARPRRAATTARPAKSRADRFWARALIETYKSAEELAAQHAHELQRGVRYKVLWRGDPRLPTLALTFDDGPHPDFTPRLLAILGQHHVKATFFVVGKMAERYPHLVRAEHAAGHVVGNHTYHHVNLTKIPLDEVPVEWEACQDVVRSITGEAMHFCRPPGGDYDGDVMRAATDLGLTTVLWTDDPGDYASPGDKVVDSRTLGRVANGGIILLHDGVQETIDVLPDILERLRSRGFQFVTVEEMQAEVRGRRGE